MTCTFVVARYRRDHDDDPTLRVFSDVTYAGHDVAAAIDKVRAPILEILIRLSIWRDGVCTERWERCVPPKKMSLRRQVRRLDGSWASVDEWIDVEDFASLFTKAST